jgi:hypothetical protein
MLQIAWKMVRTGNPKKNPQTKKKKIPKQFPTHYYLASIITLGNQENQNHFSWFVLTLWQPMSLPRYRYLSFPPWKSHFMWQIPLPTAPQQQEVVVEVRIELPPNPSHPTLGNRNHETSNPFSWLVLTLPKPSKPLPCFILSLPKPFPPHSWEP